MSKRNTQLIPSFQRPASRVIIRRCSDYQHELGTIILESLNEFHLPVRGKTILLKPNLVGLDPLGIMNTNPAVIAATRESFLRLGASEVFIGDGPAMDRDTEAILESVKLREFTGPVHGFFRDLNLDDVKCEPLPTRASRLKELYLPKTVLGVDFLVSMPKLKTHHWAGVTLSLKNMFGVVPGGCYGWPKNVLHWAGNPKAAGVLIFGDDPVAVDATGCRVMGLKPEKVSYLSRAGTLLGNLETAKIHEVGEKVASVCTPFSVLSEFRQLVA
jgi:uncharacterized protein (DUF362 family)